MAEDELIADPPEQDAPAPGPGPGDPPAPILKPEDQKLLAGMIKNMQDAKESDGNIQLAVKSFYKTYGTPAPIKAQSASEFRQSLQPQKPIVDQPANPVAQIQANMAGKAAMEQRYGAVKQQTLKEIESPDWKNKIFVGKKPALTDDPSTPLETYQHVNTDAVEDYLDTKKLTMGDRYWMRNQILNYGKQRQAQYAVEHGAEPEMEQIPGVVAARQHATELLQQGKIAPEDFKKTWMAEAAQDPDVRSQMIKAYDKSAGAYQTDQTNAVAFKLNNTGFSGEPLRTDNPFRGLITGANKTLMGVVNGAADLESTVGSLAQMTGLPGAANLQYQLQTSSDETKAQNEIPQTGEAMNYIAGQAVPAAVGAATLMMGAGAAGAPIYRALAGARATGAIGGFAEGALGGLAISPANSALMAHNYYNSLIQQGKNPAEAQGKADQLFTKNLATDMFMLPLQMGLLKLPVGGIGAKALTMGAEGLMSGALFSAQDFNQRSTDNPAVHILDYVKGAVTGQDPDARNTFLLGAALGGLQKAYADGLHNWDVKSETKNMFSFGRQYDNGDNKLLPGNPTIAANVLTALEMKDTPGRPQEIKDLVQSLQESGVYNPKEADNVNKVIDDVVAVKPQVPKYGTPEKRMAVMNELLDQRSMDRGIEASGHDAAGAHIAEMKKVSDERIGRIMSGQEPLYFIHGNETNKEQLLDAVDKHPELLALPEGAIKVTGDPATKNKITELKNEYDAIQKQKPAADAVRDTPGNGPAMGEGNEGQGAIDQKTTTESPEAGAGAGTGAAVSHVIEATHADTIHDEEKKVSGQNKVGLSDKGIVDAHDLKDEIHADHHVTKVVSSDLPRAEETAHIVADGQPTESRPGLRSWDLKDFSGMGEDDFRKALPYFAAHPDDTEYKGDIQDLQGKKLGESLNDYANRVIEARNKVDEEAPGTVLINHTNNVNLYNAYLKHGAWNKEAIDDFTRSASPGHAIIVSSPSSRDAEARTAEDVASGKIPDDVITNTVKQYVEQETGNPAGPVQLGDTSEAGSSEADATPRQLSKGPGFEEHVPTPGEGSDPDEPNKSTQSLSSRAGPTDPVKLSKQAGQLITAGRTDEQIMNYLKRKALDPETALAVLGDAKANPINEVQKAAAQKEVIDRYNGKEDDWLGRRDLNRVEAREEARQFQERIKETVPKGQNANDIDKAIHIYLDLKRNPGHYKEFYKDLTPEQKRIADLSQKLTPEQKKIADDIDEQYKQVGEEAKHVGLIQDALDYYVNRAWDLKNGRQPTEELMKFKTSSKHQLMRTLDTILQGQAEGMTLKIQGATNNLAILKQEIGNVVENQRHLDMGLKLKYDSGETDANGKPIMKTLFTTDSSEPGYAKIENPAFRKWEYAGKIKDHPDQETQSFGRRRDTLIAEDGTVLKKSDVYAPESVAKSLNNILGASKLKNVPVIGDITKFNAAAKQAVLSYSGFHFIAFTRAHLLSAKLTDFKAANPISAYKAGLNMLAEQHPYVTELIKHGMTVGRQQDFLEGVNAHNTWLGKQLDKLSATKAIKDKLIDLNTQFHRSLFESYGAGLKTFDGVNLAKKELNNKPIHLMDSAKRAEVFKRVAKLMNDTYGGINWERMRGTRMQDPTIRHISSLLLLAPDWTASNLRFAVKALGKGDEGGLYRKTWARVLLRGAIATTAANLIMAAWDDKDDEGNTLSLGEAMARRYGKAWDAGHMRPSMVDITPLYHFIGGDPGKRAYFSPLGAYTDPVKLATDFGQYLKDKSAIVTKLPLEYLTSQNWQGREFTSLDELTGLDDKGTYAKTVKEHAAGDISPTTGKPYVKDQKGHDEGDEKGGKLTGQLTKWPQGGAHPVTPGQLPSFVLSQVRGMMPNAMQALWQYAAGENDATTSILNGLGSGIYTNKDPAAKKVDNQEIQPTTEPWHP